MKKFYFLLLLIPVFAFMAVWDFPFSLLATNAPNTKSPLERLVEGNQRYVNSSTVCHEDWSAKRTALAENQAPFAVIVTCSDSRVPPEIVFDHSLGDLFVVRVAGNVVDPFAIGSIEYGVDVLGAKLVVVLGHSSCGAVHAALKGMTFDNHIQEVLSAIKPALSDLKEGTENQLEKGIKANVRSVVETLKQSQPLLVKAVQNKTVEIVGAYYDLGTGKVEFLESKKE